MITKGKSIWTIKRHFSGGYFPKRRRRSYLTTQYGPKLGLQGVKIYSCFMAYVLCRNPRICFGLHCCSYFYFFPPKFHCRAWKQGCCSVIIIIINHCDHPNIFHPHETHICIFLRQSIFSHQDMMQVARLSFAKFCKSLTLTWNVADKFIIEQIDWSFSWATFQFQLL